MAASAAETAMLIRRPAAEVFEALADPAVTARFWFTRGEGRLEPGARVRWAWDMYGPDVQAEVAVKAVEPGRRISITWGRAGEPPTMVEWTFEPRGPERTLVRVVNSGFREGEAATAKAMDTVSGFALVLASAKAWLEHGLDLRLIEDRHPDGVVADWRGRTA